MERLEKLEPEYLEKRVRNLKWLAVGGSLTAIVISTAIFLLWILRISVVDRALPILFDMKVNSAIGYGTAGGALLALVAGRSKLAAVLALWPLAIGLLSVFEYAASGLGVDQLIVTDWSANTGPYPGRTSLNAAAILVALGGVLLALAVSAGDNARKMAVRLVACAVIAVAMEAIAGRIGQSPFAAGWGPFHPMSLPSAVCALAIAAGLLAQEWKGETAIISRIPVWIPILLCFAVVMLDVLTPLDLNVGICYTPFVLCAFWFQRSNVAFIFATVATLLIVLGLFASPPGHIAFGMAAVNRTLATASIWVSALLVYRHHVVNARLRHSEHHFAVAQRMAQIGSYELYFADMALHGSAAFGVMHGLPIDREQDWKAFLRQAIPPDERGAIDEVVAAGRRGETSRDLEYSFLRSDGEVRNAVMHCDILLSEAGVPAGLVGVVHDVTEARRAEAQQADIQVQLRHAQKLEALGMLAGGIAHDLNNTLVPVTTLAPLLHETANGGDRQILDIIIDAARRAKELVREMLVYSRKDEAAPTSIRLDQMVREALQIIRAGIPAHIVIIDELGPVPEISGSKGQLYQTILNLATNAAHAIGDRAGTITIGTSMELHDSGPADIRLYVADDGAGMDSATAQRVFEPYFSTKGAKHGTGLGLSIVNGIVKKHGGSILVRSVPGEGTRFDLLFPARAAA